MKAFLSGNEAIARGAYEAGVKFASAYPGTPSTEILENLTKYDDIRTEWSTNEKVALDVGYGAALGGIRVLVSMKHVGLNVASDTFMVTPFAGVNGGLVIISADDPGMHSSQNEQDNRYLAKFAKIPMLEPTDAQEAKDFVALALDLSETFDVPVMLRTTTRTAHTKGLVELGERNESPAREFKRNPTKHVVPVHARFLRPNLEERIAKLAEYNETFAGNTIENPDGEFGVITSGIAYQYAREVLPEAAFLKLTMTFPLPKKKILDFIDRYEKVYVIEELEPYIEEHIRSWGISRIIGKELITNIGELAPDIISKAFKGFTPPQNYAKEIDIPPRPPKLCAGCPHSGTFYALRKLKVTVTGDIGCYTLGCLPPLKALHTTFCMGAGIGAAFGLEIAQPEKMKEKLVAVIGDSTFLHSGIPELLDIVYNKGNVTVVIVDNRTTGMTGHQQHPGSGFTAKNEPAKAVDYADLCRALGVEDVRVVDPYELDKTMTAMRESLQYKGPSVVISKRECVMLPEIRRKEHPVYQIDEELCEECMKCLMLGCPAIEGGEGHPWINQGVCIGCGLCAQICDKCQAIDLIAETV